MIIGAWKGSTNLCTLEKVGAHRGISEQKSRQKRTGIEAVVEPKSR